MEVEDKIDSRKSFSIFQKLLLSFIISGLIIIVILQTNNYFSFKHWIKEELKTRFSNSIEEAAADFDKAYRIYITNDLNFIEDSYPLNSFLSSTRDEMLLSATLVEQLFLHFTNRTKGIYLSLRFIDMDGVEKIVTEGNKRIKNHVSLSTATDDVFYARVNALFSQLKSQEAGVILSEGPFQYQDKETFLVGSVKLDPETGRRAGVVIFHCDLETYFKKLSSFEFYGEHVAEAVSLDNRMIFSMEEKNIAGENYKKDFYTLTKKIIIGSNDQILFKLIFSISPEIFRREVKKVFANSLLFLLLVVMIMSGIAFIVSIQLSQPLIRLVDSVRRFAKGNLSVRVQTNTTGEIQLLADTFNSMAETLDASIQIERKKEAELVNEINERKKTEVELRKAYEQMKQIQVQLIHSEKLASIGHLAAGIAHEINNPLAFIDNNMQILDQYVGSLTKILKVAEDLRNNVVEGNMERGTSLAKEMANLEKELELDYVLKDLDELLQQNHTGVERIKRIVMDLRTFAREDKEDVILSVKIENVIDDILNIVNNELKYKAELRKDYGDTPLINCNAQHLGQVFINLLLNATQAINEKGIIEVKTYTQGEYVCVDITDTGHGIPPENLYKIFDPFYTTKPVGKGTGLGLSISFEIVKKQGGEIKVHSIVGKGTTFTVMLPIQNKGKIS